MMDVSDSPHHIEGHYYDVPVSIIVPQSLGSHTLITFVVIFTLWFSYIIIVLVSFDSIVIIGVWMHNILCTCQAGLSRIRIPVMWKLSIPILWVLKIPELELELRHQLPYIGRVYMLGATVFNKQTSM